MGMKSDTMEGNEEESLCEDIILFNILPRLPATSLLRSKSVCKTWARLISSNPSFISKQSECTSGQVSGFFFQKRDKSQYVCLDRKSNTGIPDPFLDFLGDEVCVKASCNGVVLCQSLLCGCYYICNPLTKQHIALPSSNRHDFSSLEGFAFFFPPLCSSWAGNDPLYMIVCPYQTYLCDGEFKFAIFSSHTNIWKVCSEKIQCGSLTTRALFVSGLLYWGTGSNYILSFDPRRENCQLIPLPLVLLKSHQLVEFDGMLAYVEIKNCGSDLKVWTLRNLTGSEWAVSYSIGSTAVAKEMSEFFEEALMKMKVVECGDNAERSDAIHEHSSGLSWFRPLPYVGGDVVLLRSESIVIAYNTTKRLGDVISGVELPAAGKGFVPHRNTLTFVPSCGSAPH